MIDTLSIGFETNKDRQMALSYDIKDINQLQIPKDPVLAYLSIRKLASEEKVVTDTYIYMVGYEINKDEAFDLEEEFKLFNFKECLNKCSQEDKKEEAKLQNALVKTFADSDELIQAVVDFTTNFLDDKDISVVDDSPKIYCKM